MQKRSLRSFYLRRLWMLAVGAVLLGVGVAPAQAADERSAAQHQNAYLYAFWNYAPSSTMTDVNQQVRFTKKAPSTYLALNWGWAGAPDGGYMGLQTDGIRFDGSTGGMAIYSLWNATAARASSGATCGEFDGEGTGWSCRRPLRIDSDHFYRLHVSRAAAAVDGQWWKAYVQDVVTGTKYGLGSIKVTAAATAISAPMNFSEYFGEAMPTCDDVPRSVADWKRPRGNLNGDGVETVGTYASSARGDCTGGSVSPQDYAGTPGVKIVLGGVVK